MAEPGTAPRASAKREALLDAAQELFARQGYRAVGIDTVLARAGVAKMTLYKHFASKEELIAAVLERQGQRIGAALGERIAAAPAGGPERVLVLFDWLVEGVRSPGFHGCLFIKAASEYPDPEDLPRQAAVAFKQECGTLLAGLCRDLPVADADGLARQLQLLFEGTLVMAFLQRSPQAADDARDAAATLLQAASRARG